MHIPTRPLTLSLKRDQFVRIEHPRGVQVRADRGTLWITIDGEPQDIELDPGASFAFVGSDAPALIGVLGPAAVATLHRREPAWRARWSGWWRPHARPA